VIYLTPGFRELTYYSDLLGYVRERSAANVTTSRTPPFPLPRRVAMPIVQASPAVQERVT
jgi:hypothetical protein